MKPFPLNDISRDRGELMGLAKVLIILFQVSLPRHDSEYGLAALAASALVFLCSLTFTMWIIVPFLVCIATYCLVKSLPLWLLRVFDWVGGISAAIFVCHPITRKVLIPISRHDDLYAGLLLYILATIFLAILFSRMLSSLMKR
ncbi:MAG: hypothetical protein SPJ79_01820 [Prevotella sp.]|nr:hypothetical protein [Bacteroidales bacterium]MDY5876312.1 hypothetical protein [Prevotella sp.]